MDQDVERSKCILIGLLCFFFWEQTVYLIGPSPGLFVVWADFCNSLCILGDRRLPVWGTAGKISAILKPVSLFLW